MRLLLALVALAAIAAASAHRKKHCGEGCCTYPDKESAAPSFDRQKAASRLLKTPKSSKSSSKSASTAAPEAKESLKPKPSRSLRHWEHYCSRHGVVVRNHCHCLACRYHCTVPGDCECPFVSNAMSSAGYERIGCNKGHSVLTQSATRDAPLHGVRQYVPSAAKSALSAGGYEVGCAQCPLTGQTYDEETEYIIWVRGNSNPRYESSGDAEVFRKHRKEDLEYAKSKCITRRDSYDDCRSCMGFEKYREVAQGVQSLKSGPPSPRTPPVIIDYNQYDY